MCRLEIGDKEILQPKATKWVVRLDLTAVDSFHVNAWLEEGCGSSIGEAGTNLVKQ